MNDNGGKKRQISLTIAVMHDASCRQNCQFIIEPNRSMSLRGNLTFYLSLICLSFGIAGGFAWMGLWMILPFAGFEMLILGGALYWCWRRGFSKEVITVEKQQITVRAYTKTRQISYTFPRYWTQVTLTPASFRGYPHKLYIRSHGQQVEIGQTLRNEEKESLACALNEVIPIRTAPLAS